MQNYRNLNQQQCLAIAQTRSQKVRRLTYAFLLFIGISISVGWSAIYWGLLSSTIWFVCMFASMAIGIIYLSISAILLSICPYCHEFAKVNKGTAFYISIGGLAYGKESTITINPDCCSKCGAPLTEQAVTEYFRLPEN